MKLKNTKDVHTNGVKLLVYGMAGAGKTHLIQTLPNPVILSAESGLLSLSGVDLPYIEINSMKDLGDAYVWLTASKEAAQFDSVALDSISEISEIVLNTEKNIMTTDGKKMDGRKAYGEMQDQMYALIRSFRDLPGKNVYMSAKCEKSQDETGRMLYSAMMPGKKLSQMLPYFFDEVFALRVENGSRMLQTDSDTMWSAKDRSGKLNQWETPNLTEIINKITGVN